MSKEPRNPVLGDHVPLKRKLIPPFVSALGGKLSLYSWTRQLVPEALWLGLIIDRFGYDSAREICRSLVLAAQGAFQEEPSPLFVKASAYGSLDEKAKATIISKLEEPTLVRIQTALRPLRRVSVDHPLAFLDDGAALESEDAERLPAIVPAFYDRNSRLAVLSLALAYELGLAQGKVHVAPHLIDGLNHAFAVIGDYPTTEASEDAAGRFRAAAPMLLMVPLEDGSGFREDDSWVGLFWDGVAGLGPCLFEDTFKNEDGEDDDSVEAFVRGFRNAVRTDLRARLNEWHLSLNEIEAFEVIAALLSRQATLAIEFAAAPSMWTPHSGPVTLRAMADVFITTAWILKDPGPRATKFVEDGLGAIKLQIAHQERALETAAPEDVAEIKIMIEVWREWLTMQRMEQFVEVNLGSWSGLNTRKMAEEAGFLDFYNYVYQPFSGVAHSNWAHVSMFNTLFCENPAHRGHRVPAMVPTPPDLNWLFLAAKYLTKTLKHFDDTIGLVDMPSDAFDYFGEQPEDVSGAMS
ncbi:MAG TPA: DUF5677 domain-containing protein [Brevundimonas sp.]|jgi:hypothetical protein|uniref:DUF5677 domain-containing protein n=1 Tax=Brevundimonas sp. TaxID=1871086 RepID=UPI002E0E64B7|nr:DUF5677 domain-containing protein [Brevundimonas sp.]